LYIIHGDFNGQNFPLIYCFLSNKTEEAYVNAFAFNLIKSSLANQLVNFSPSSIQIDFEAAAYNAVRRCFPFTQVTGCFFHFGQAVWRRVQALGLVSLYNLNGHFAELVQMIIAIALVPIDEIDNVWTYVRSIYNFDNENVQSLPKYVEINWISDSRPLFSREVWSHYGTLCGRTNNVAEGFHSKLNKLINKNNSSFLEILYTLKDMQISNEVELNRLIAGGKPKRRKKVYVDQEGKIERLWCSYNSRLISL
jgi:hypothetical protein